MVWGVGVFRLFEMIKDFRFKRAIRRLGGKVAGGRGTFARNSSVLLEQFVSLGHVKILSRDLRVGAHTYIRSGTRIEFVASIGRYCSIGSDCIIGQEKRNHPINWVSTHPFQYERGGLEYSPVNEAVKIGHDVWVGHEATIMEGVRVGTGAVVATKALVTKDVPPYAIVGGNPAKILGYRHDDSIIKRLLDSQWWELDISLLSDLPCNDPVSFLSRLETVGATNKATYREFSLGRNVFNEA